MVDTIRSSAQILALLADNTSGGISAQDIRDFYVSSQQQHGGCYISTPAATIFADSINPVKALGTTTIMGDVRNFTMPVNNRLTYTGAAPIGVDINAGVSLTAAGNNKDIQLSIAKNGIVITSTITERKIATGTDVGQATIVGKTTLSTNDFIEVFVVNTTDLVAVTFQRMSFIVRGTVI